MYKVFVVFGWLGLLPLLAVACHFGLSRGRSERTWKLGFLLSSASVSFYTVFVLAAASLNALLSDGIMAVRPTPNPGGPSIPFGGFVSVLAVFLAIVPLNYLSLVVMCLDSAHSAWHSRRSAVYSAVAGGLLALAVHAVLLRGAAEA